MKLSMNTKHFMAACAIAARIAKQGSFLTVGFRRIAGTVEVSAVGADGYFDMTIPSTSGDGDDPGCCVYADTLGRMAATLGHAPFVTIEDEGNGSAKFESGNFSAHIIRMPHDLGPMPTKATTHVIEMERAAFLEAFASVRYAMPKKDHRRILTGACVEIGSDAARMTATCGKKLRRRTATVAVLHGEGACKFVVPGASLAFALRAAREDEGEHIRMELSDGHVTFRGSNWTLTCGTLDGRYPDCDAIIPKVRAHVVEFNKSALRAAIGRVATFAEDRNLTVEFKATADGATLSAFSADTGRCSEKLPCSLVGETLEFAFNSEHLIETLAQIKDTQVRIVLRDEQSPVVIESDNTNGLIILMPIKLADVRAERSEPATDRTKEVAA